MRRSKSARRRAIVLAAVHLVIIIHVAQWMLTGTTISPIEPSESMETLRDGRVNAGFVFFAGALAATLVFGRFVCGWGCHWIAYQDLCTWLLRKVGIRPKPFRSRLIAWVPLVVALYMFAWPRVYMWWHDVAAPETTVHLTTTRFWQTFPGPGVAVLAVLVAGFGIVYFLGNKGFCAYACPYGALFGLMDKAAPGRIRVTEDCNGCGHCTATCTSNVRVHEEVRAYGMVVDPGCMKTLDCVAVCPKNALYYGFGKPSISARKRTPGAVSRLRRAFTWPEELALALLFSAFFFSVRGLYELFPLLATTGIAGIGAYLGLTALRVAYRPNVRLHNIALKRDGRIRVAGWMTVAASLLLYGLVGHSAMVQYHTRLGNHHYDRIASAGSPGSVDGTSPELSVDTIRETVRRSLSHLSWAERWGLRDTARLCSRLGWLHFLSGDPYEAERLFRRAIILDPADAANDYLLANLLVETGRAEEALTHYASALERRPDWAEAHYNFGLALMSLDRLEEATAHYRDAVRLSPEDADALNNLGLALATAGAYEEAVTYLEQAIERRPTFADAHFNLARVFAVLGRAEAAAEHLEQACAHDKHYCTFRLQRGGTTSDSR